MNKDLMLIKGPPPGKLWPEDFIPETIGTAETVRQMISAVLPEVRWSAPLLGSLEADDTDMLFSLPEDTDEIASIDLEVGRRGNPEAVLKLLCEGNGWCLFDMVTAEFIEPEPAKKWWQIWK